MALYVGVDLHRDYSMVTVLGARGKPLRQVRLRNDNLGDFLASLREKPAVVLEATRNWAYPVELMEPHARQVVLAHPKKTKAIASAKIKTDKIDSETLARLLRSDLVPTSYIPPQEIRDLRDLLRHRAGLVRLRTRVKNRVHVVLGRYGLVSPFSDLFGVAGRRWLRALSGLRPTHREMLDRYLRVIEALEAEITPLSEEIEGLVADDTEAQLLCTIPGIGRYSALLVLAEIGESSRFPDPKHLASYAGLVPSVRASGGRTHLGGITHEGSAWLRWILIQAAPKAVRGSPRLASLYQRMARRRGPQKAKVAVAHELLVIIWHMLHSKQPYQERSRKHH
jgi:transposase